MRDPNLKTKFVSIEYGSVRRLNGNEETRYGSGPRVEAMYEERAVVMELLSAPNAIGICKLRYNGVELHRHVNRIRCITDEAKAIVDGGSAGIVRSASAFVAELECAPIADLTKSPPAAFTVAQVEALFKYVRMRVHENQALSARARSKARRQWHRAENARLTLLLEFVREWRSDARRRAMSMEAGLSSEDFDNPNVLIARLYKTLHRVKHEAATRHPEDGFLLTEEENRLLSVCHDYLTRHASAGEIPDEND